MVVGEPNTYIKPLYDRLNGCSQFKLKLTAGTSGLESF